MKRFVVMMLMFVACIAVSAQNNHNNGNNPYPQFDPKKFEAGLEEFVVKEAGITQQEAGRFLVIYREKRKKEVESMEAMRKHRSGKPTNEKEWAEQLKAHDNMEIQLKKIQQEYHNKMLRVIPASKVVKVVFAEERYHRDAFGRMHNSQRKQNAPQHKGNQEGRRFPHPQKR